MKPKSEGEQPVKPTSSPAKTEPAATQPAAERGGDAWVFDDGEDPAREKQLWGQGAAYAADGKNHVIKIRFAEGREEDWGEYGPHRIVSTTPPKKNFDVSPYRYLAFRIRADREMEVVLKVVTKPEGLPAGDESHFWFSVYPRTKAGEWEWIVVDLAKMELGEDGGKAYSAAGKPARPQHVTCLMFAAHQKNEKADYAIDDLAFYRVLPKSLADKVERP